MKLIHWCMTGHWPKRFRYPNGIPRAEVKPEWNRAEVAGGAVRVPRPTVGLPEQTGSVKRP